MKYSFKLLIPTILLIVSCSTNKDYILKEKDLIPEGTAFNTNTNTIYIGSIYKQKVITISPKGNIKTIITESEFGDLSPIGIEMDNKRNTLWINVALAPIINQTNKKDWRTTIMSFDVLNQKLIKKYDLIKGERTFLNDITVANNGDVYATESVENKIYKIDKNTDVLSPFIDLKGYHFPNGIIHYQPQNCLFVATDEGILKIDVEKKTYTLIKCKDEINTMRIDGLAINDNYFIGHQSTKISKFYFDKNITTIQKVEILDEGTEFDSSTTGEVGNGYYHYIVNSQLQSGIDRTGKHPIVKPLDSLENIIIRKVKL